MLGRDWKERNKDLQAPDMLTIMNANLPGGRGASPPLAAMFPSKDSIVVEIETTHGPCEVIRTRVQTLAIRFFHSCGVVLFHGRRAIVAVLVKIRRQHKVGTFERPRAGPRNAGPALIGLV